jgi:hypothetical protein
METPPELALVAQAALQLQQFCSSRGWEFCFIGGVAYQAWGEPRTTLDADITLLTGFDNEEIFVDELLRFYKGRRTDARNFALRARVLLLVDDQGVGIDIGLGALPFEANAVRRALEKEVVKGVVLRVCTPEDLIVHKAFASRDQDWADIDKTLMRQGKKLNIPQIFADLGPLVELKEDPDIVPRLERMMRKRGVL